MNDEAALPGGSASSTPTDWNLPPQPARITGLQAAQVGLAAQLEAWEQQFSPTEFAVLVDIHARYIARKRDRYQRCLARLGLEEAA